MFRVGSFSTSSVLSKRSSSVVLDGFSQDSPWVLPNIFRQCWLFLKQIWRLVHFQLLYAAMNLTSNEMFNYKRYNYLKNARGKYHNPFSRGVCHNMAEYFACISPAEPEHASIRDLWTPTIGEFKQSGLVIMNKMWSISTWFKPYFREFTFGHSQSVLYL